MIQGIEALEWIKALKWEDNSLPASALLSYSDWYNYVATGRAAMAICGNDVIRYQYLTSIWTKLCSLCTNPAGLYGHRYSLMGGLLYVFFKCN